MTEQRLVEILEDHAYGVGIDQRTGRINAYMVGCAEIEAQQTEKSNTGWVFRVGKNTLSNVEDAINFSKRRITR